MPNPKISQIRLPNNTLYDITDEAAQILIQNLWLNIGRIKIVRLTEEDFTENYYPNPGEEYTGALYYVGTRTENVYEQYVCVEDGNGGYEWISLGTTEVDLSGYSVRRHTHNVTSNTTGLDKLSFIRSQSTSKLQTTTIYPIANPTGATASVVRRTGQQHVLSEKSNVDAFTQLGSTQTDYPVVTAVETTRQTINNYPNAISSISTTKTYVPGYSGSTSQKPYVSGLANSGEVSDKVMTGLGFNTVVDSISAPANVVTSFNTGTNSNSGIIGNVSVSDGVLYIDGILLVTSPIITHTLTQGLENYKYILKTTGYIGTDLAQVVSNVSAAVQVPTQVTVGSVSRVDTGYLGKSTVSRVTDETDIRTYDFNDIFVPTAGSSITVATGTVDPTGSGATVVVGGVTGQAVTGLSSGGNTVVTHVNSSTGIDVDPNSTLIH